MQNFFTKLVSVVLSAGFCCLCINYSTCQKTEKIDIRTNRVETQQTTQQNDSNSKEMEGIKKAKDRFKGFIESAPDAIVIVNHLGEIQIVNIQTEKLFGFPRIELIGKKVEILIPAKYKTAHSDHRKGFTAEPTARTMGKGMELFGQHKDGSQFPVAISISQLESDEGILISATIRDVSYEKDIEKALTKAKEDAEKTNRMLEIKNKEIIQSIEYALKIQTAILPPRKIVQQYLEDSFILYKPKDIVAGDFYWMEIVDDLVLFAACDCTGHGVPGALVSLICHNSLNRAVREFGLLQPAAILDKTCEILVESFSKSEEGISDGMDISLCAFNPKTKILEWAGAHNDLWLYKEGKLIETKADKQHIGLNESRKPFTNHALKLNDTDTIYLFTDGFADQFGGEIREKKLTKKRFKELLSSVQHLSMFEQGIALDNFLTEYKRELEQIDDVLIIGMKV